VQGASFALWVDTSKKQSLHGWHIDSLDTSVMTVGAPVLSDDEQALSTPAVAVNAGQVELHVVDSAGEIRHSHTVEVKFPDRVDVLPHGPLLIGRPNVASEEHPIVLHDGEATFLVQYFNGGEQLFGHGTLGTVPSSDIDAHAEKTSFLEDRDWLVVDASLGGVSQEIGVTVAGAMARMLPIDTIDETQLDHVKLSDEDESHASDKQWLVVLAEAFDGAQHTVHGVDFDFTADAVAQTGIGDLYRYEFSAKIPVMLEATHGAHTDGLMIHSAGGFVDSTNHLGCSSAPGDASTGLYGVALLLLVLAARRYSARGCAAR
jgi:MYXO-CTERM domain-containing protein